ncbi:AI-2E family transporter [Bacillus testis]|uniref:AI-2E family transporter n=1 Tax=Bacillus testis TaxID=1622072 RepID=UPI00067ED7C4|nr:AI-2E family transporter [Bacillus testis]
MSSGKFKNWSLQILILLTIIFVSTKISFLLEPIGIFFSTLFFPLLISGFLFFIFNPVLKILQKWLKLPRIIAIILLYVLVIALISLVIGNIVPIITKQISAFIEAIPVYGKQIEQFFDRLTDSKDIQTLLANDYISLETFQHKLTEFMNTLPGKITNGVFGIFGFVTNATITIVTVPVLLFYMFKDGHRLPVALAKFIPGSYRREGLKIIEDVGTTLSNYISGQVTVACCVGILSLIGFLIIDVPYALVMALIVAVTNIIPYVGPILGGAPAVIVALFDSPFQAVLVVIVITIAQQLEGNFLSPLILGKTLDIHPVTVIVMLLVAGNIAGVIGMVLAVPTYAVCKTIILSMIKLLNARKQAELET